MTRTILCIAACLMLLTSCNKAIDSFIEKQFNSTPPPAGFIKYTIKKGEHSADKSAYKPIETSELHFMVKFDSSAIYQSATTENQYDINKLYGFADNNADHHQYSARIGWRWSGGALRLFGYIYNKGVMQENEIAAIPIGTEINCSIRVAGEHYTFIVNDAQLSMPRSSTTEKAKGYQLYPYFGGDETAPHDVQIWIKNL